MRKEAESCHLKCNLAHGNFTTLKDKKEKTKSIKCTQNL